MTHYICPICDMELKGRKYCATCRKFVRDPIIYHGETMPNEHGDDCFMPNRRNQKEPVANVGRAYTQQAPRRTAPQRPTSGQTASRPIRPTYMPGQAAPRPNSGKGVGVIVFVIWMIIVFLISILGN